MTKPLFKYARRLAIGVRGLTLVEVMITAGIMTVIMLAFAQMLVSQQKETRALSEKIAILDLQGLLGKSFADGTACAFSLVDITANPSNPTHFVDPLGASSSGNIPTGLQPTLPLTNLYSSAIGLPPPLLATTIAPDPASRLGVSLQISSINLVIIRKLAPHQFSGEIRISLSGGVRTYHPAFVSVVLQTTTVGGFEQIQKCSLNTNTSCNWKWVSASAGGFGSYFGQAICDTTGIMRGLDVLDCSGRDATQRDYCFRIYCCY